MKNRITTDRQRFMLRLAATLCLVVGTQQVLPTQAQVSSELTATYGRGVHAYFDGQISQAEDYFTQVILAGSKDPRVYYFRAMTRMRSGRQEEAVNDMQVGAAHEARNPGDRHTIGRALQRVQGPHRRTLEKYRRQARLNRLEERRRQTHDRYEQLQQRESTVLRRPQPYPLEQLLEPGLSPPAPSETDGATPDAAPVPAAKPDPDLVEPAMPLPAPGESADEFDPFEEPAASEDIFAEPSEAEEPEAQDADIFTEPDAQPEETAEEEDPFASTPPAAADEPSEPFDTGPTDDEAPVAASLQPSDKVEPVRMAGILGRIVGSVMPWRGIEVPSISPPGASFDGEVSEIEISGGVELGPFDEDEQVVQASAEEPFDGPMAVEEADAEEDLFGEPAEGAETEPSGDLFGEPVEDSGGSKSKVEELEPEAEADESPTDEPSEEGIEDPFADI